MERGLDIFHYLHTGAVVLTPNNRLSLHLSQQYHELYQSQTRPLLKPLCFSYEAWLNICFLQNVHQNPNLQHPILANSQQQRHIWKPILQKHTQAIPSSEFLDSIQEAWQCCMDWQIKPDDPALRYHPHSHQFQIWFLAFEKSLKDHQAITTAHLPTYLMQAKFMPANPCIIWTCFDEFTPLQKTFQTYFNTQGCLQLFDDFKEKPIQGFCFPAQNQEDELEQAILWAQQGLNKGEQRIALIIPDLQNQIQKVKSLFTQHFSSEMFNISYGQPLSDYPIINSALECLCLDHTRFSTQQLRFILSSAFIRGGKSEFTIRSHLLQDNKLFKQFYLPWNTVLNQLQSSAPELFACIKGLSAYPQQDSPAAWSLHFKQRLYSIGFPGEFAVDSYLYQCLKRLEKALDEFMSINAVVSHFSVAEALQSFKELCKSIVFQIQKPPAPISILGMLEASGCQYDSIWISGLTEQCLPKKTKCSPFLPIHLQKALAMPYTDPQHEFERAQLVLNRFGYACQSIVFSYPSTIGE